MGERSEKRVKLLVSAETSDVAKKNQVLRVAPINGFSYAPEFPDMAGLEVVDVVMTTKDLRAFADGTRFKLVRGKTKNYVKKMMGTE